MLNKRAQASDAIVWIIVTLSVIVILTIFMFISSVFAKANGKIIAISKVFESEDLTNVDLIAAKNEIALDIYPIANNADWLNEVVA